jgi:acyl carrier protein
MREEIYQKVASLISQSNDIAPESISIDATFDELGMDSLDGLALISDLEAHYNITIPNQEAMKIRSIKETVEKLETLLVVQQ